MDPFTALELPPGATAEEISAAYRRLAKRWHPDRGGGAGAAARMAEINVAYDVLRSGAWQRPDASAAQEPAVTRVAATRGLAGSWLEEPLRRALGRELLVALDKGEAVALVTPAATWASPRTLLAVTDRRLLWLLDDAPTHRVRSLRVHRDRRDRPPAAPPAAEGRGAAGTHEERAHPLLQRAAPGDRGGDRRARRGRAPGRPRGRLVSTPPLFGRLPEQYFTRILTAVAAARAEPGPRVIDLGRGNPDLPPPPHAIEALRAAARETTVAMHGYPKFQGEPDLKAAIAERYRADHGVDLDPEREVAVVPGTKTGIMFATLAAAGPGDGVLLPDPGYPDYRSAIALAAAREVPLPLDPTAGHQPDFDAVPAAERDRRAAARPQLPVEPVRGLRPTGHVRRRGRVRPRPRHLAAQRPRLRVPRLRRPPRGERARVPGRPRGRGRALVAVEDLRDGRLADRLRRRRAPR